MPYGERVSFLWGVVLGYRMLPLMPIPFRGLDGSKKSPTKSGQNLENLASFRLTEVKEYHLLDTEPLQLDPERDNT